MRIFRRLHDTLDRVDATLERNTQAFERNTHAFERNTHAFEDLQVVIRENRILAERNSRAFIAALERMDERQDAAFRDMRAEIRANTQAILRMLDRWGEGPSPAS